MPTAVLLCKCSSGLTGIDAVSSSICRKHEALFVPSTRLLPPNLHCCMPPAVRLLLYASCCMPPETGLQLHSPGAPKPTWRLQSHPVAQAPAFWRQPYKALLNSRHLTEYMILDIEPTGQTAAHGKLELADAQVARVADLGSNDTTYHVRTHLGHLLHPGDTALGYDLTRANFVDDELEAYVQKGRLLPDVVLVSVAGLLGLWRRCVSVVVLAVLASGQQPWRLCYIALLQGCCYTRPGAKLPQRSLACNMCNNFRTAASSFGVTIPNYNTSFAPLHHL